jgi:hypothetical protein
MSDARLEFSDLLRESVAAHGNSSHDAWSELAMEHGTRGLDDYLAKRNRPTHQASEDSFTLSVPINVLMPALPAGLLTFAGHEYERVFNRRA